MGGTWTERCECDQVVVRQAVGKAGLIIGRGFGHRFGALFLDIVFGELSSNAFSWDALLRFHSGCPLQVPLVRKHADAQPPCVATIWSRSCRSEFSCAVVLVWVAGCHRDSWIGLAASMVKMRIAMARVDSLFSLTPVL